MTLKVQSAQGDVEVPYIIIQALIYTVITYFMMDFEHSAGPYHCSPVHNCICTFTLWCASRTQSQDSGVEVLAPNHTTKGAEGI